ncbi:hypothetical protein, partial [Methanoculleus chikugoensis]|uniref:hypothetical protein n=1 Tax=Methanoculleus chikugoensis TaxID=118126 RepID=UPI001FB5644C
MQQTKRPERGANTAQWTVVAIATRVAARWEGGVSPLPLSLHKRTLLTTPTRASRSSPAPRGGR